MVDEITTVIVFDGNPTPVGITRPVYGSPVVITPTPAYGRPVVAMTGRPGAKGDPGDENVVVLELGQEPEDLDIPDNRIIYRLLEEI